MKEIFQLKKETTYRMPWSAFHSFVHLGKIQNADGQTLQTSAALNTELKKLLKTEGKLELSKE